MTLIIQTEFYKGEELVHKESIELGLKDKMPETLVFDAEEYRLVHYYRDKAKYFIVTLDDEIPF